MGMQHVDNVDNHFSFVHMTHKSFSFLRGNSLRGDLWTMWTMWTSILNRWLERVGNYPTVYIYSILFCFSFHKYIVHIVHKPPKPAQAVPLRVGQTTRYLLSTHYPHCPHFMQFVHTYK